MTATAVLTKSKPIARRITRNRPPQITANKRTLDPDVYYTIRELSDRASPYRIVSPATLFRALKAGTLKANYVGRKVFLKGAAIKAWIEGGEGK